MSHRARACQAREGDARRTRPPSAAPLGITSVVEGLCVPGSAGVARRQANYTFLLPFCMRLVYIIMRSVIASLTFDVGDDC